MGKEGLVGLVKDAQTLKDAFRNLKDQRVITASIPEFVIVDSRREFAIVKELGEKPSFYLHPYGSGIGYNVMEQVRD